MQQKNQREQKEKMTDFTIGDAFEALQKRIGKKNVAKLKDNYISKNKLVKIKLNLLKDLEDSLGNDQSNRILYNLLKELVEKRFREL